jgi:hypothetical protein
MNDKTSVNENENTSVGKNLNTSTGISYGIITGLVYCLLLFWRWSSASNMITFGISALVGYCVVMAIMFYEAYYRRKQEGGFVTLKNLFQTLFISVLIFELIYAIYNFIHLKYIDPEVIDRMKSGMSAMLDKAGSNMSDEDKEKALSRFEEMRKATQIGQILKSYLMSLAISGVVALLISLIMKKKRPVFQEIN